MEYANVSWDGCSVCKSDIIESVQYEAAKVVTGVMKGTSKSRLMEELAWEDMGTSESNIN